jgi:PPK2 family polyphosphate:nucleotide phosphotransferase
LKPKLRDIIEHFRVVPGKRVKLAEHDPAWSGDKRVPKQERKEFSKQVLTQDVSKLAQAQELLYASDTHSILLVFQAMDAAGKDGTIKHVMSGVNPQGCQVFSFKKPSAEELDHDFLWRCAKVLPERGRIGIFNRSYYEEVLVVRVHPEYLKLEQLPVHKFGKQFWSERYDSINNFERHLTLNGTTVIKFFLNVSKKEQRKRFLERIEEPQKHWKFSVADLAERGHWDDYMRAYEEALTATSTKWAPWYIVPADNKWVTRASVAAIIVDTIESLDLRYPKITADGLQRIAAAKLQLEKEKN